MPHWHLVLWPRNDGDLSRFMFWLTLTHTARWRHARKLVGLGPLYQGRFKSFPVETDRHLLVVLRYVERNPLRANLVSRAQDWQHASLAARMAPASEVAGMLHPWPIAMPADYLELVNRPQTATEEEAMRTSIRRNRPYGDSEWQQRTRQTAGARSEPASAWAASQARRKVQVTHRERIGRRRQRGRVCFFLII